MLDVLLIVASSLTPTCFLFFTPTISPIPPSHYPRLLPCRTHTTSRTSSPSPSPPPSPSRKSIILHFHRCICRPVCRVLARRTDQMMASHGLPVSSAYNANTEALCTVPSLIMRGMKSIQASARPPASQPARYSPTKRHIESSSGS